MAVHRVVVIYRERKLLEKLGIDGGRGKGERGKGGETDCESEIK